MATSKARRGRTARAGRGPTKRKFVAYYRVSTDRQGKSGLGVEAQREAVAGFLNGNGDWTLIAEYTEVESGKRSDRPELDKALQHCKVTGAKLVIAKIDRLSRDAHFLLGLQKAGVPFVAADMPDANELTINIMALIAQQERQMISERTKAALAAAKRRGVKLGNPKGAKHLRKYGNKAAVEGARQSAQAWAEERRVIIDDIRAGGVTSLEGIARELNARGIETRRAGGQWHPTSVRRLLERLGAA